MDNILKINNIIQITIIYYIIIKCIKYNNIIYKNNNVLNV